MVDKFCSSLSDKSILHFLSPQSSKYWFIIILKNRYLVLYFFLNPLLPRLFPNNLRWRENKDKQCTHFQTAPFFNCQRFMCCAFLVQTWAVKQSERVSASKLFYVEHSRLVLIHRHGNQLKHRCTGLLYIHPHTQKNPF